MGLREDNERAARVPEGKWEDYLMGRYRLPPAPYPTDPSTREHLSTTEMERLRGD